MINSALIQDFIQLIARQTGMQVQDRDRVELVKKIGMRMAAQKLATPEAYYQLLATPSIQGSKDETNRDHSRAQE